MQVMIKGKKIDFNSLPASNSIAVGEITSSNDCLPFSDQKCYFVNKRKEMLRLTSRDLLNKVMDDKFTASP